ncbi:MAG: hypothetical protein KGQ49_03075 [Verrucomicrobia bacterium]|nr:hypothetical protein [Verrucomicrobiota bacterium]MBU6446365.1 hypothetical protein [Verrucomicrobiota bacterium]MDE3047664.1 hypothetical protein [Verrucomicrobiota bacterium]
MSHVSQIQQEIASYMANIATDMETAEKLIKQLIQLGVERHNEHKAYLHARYEYEYYNSKHYGQTGEWKKKMDSDEQLLNQTKGQIAKETGLLEQIDPNFAMSGGAALVNQIAQLISARNDLANTDMTEADQENAGNHIEHILKQLYNALINTVRSGMTEEIMSQVSHSKSADASAILLQLGAMAMQDTSTEQFDLQGIQNGIFVETENLQEEKSRANANLQTYHWYDVLKSVFTGDTYTNRSFDRAQIAGATAMLAILQDVDRGLAPLMQFADPAMQQIQLELQELKRKFEALLAGHASLRQFQDAMVEALSILVGIIAETTKDAAMFNKEMNKGSMASYEMHFNHSVQQQKVMDAARQYAKVMGVLMKVAEYAGMALVFALNPGIAMGIVIAIQIALQVTGEMHKLQTYLCQHLGTIGGAVMQTLIEMVGTAGGAAGIEAMMSRFLFAAAQAAATEAVATSVSSAVQSAVQTAEQCAARVGETAAQDALANGSTEDEAWQIGQEAEIKALSAAKTVAQTTVDKAVETAQEKIGAIYLNKAILGLLRGGRKGLQEALTAASKEAAERAGQAVAVLAQTAARDGTASGIGADEMEAVAIKAANKAVATTMKMSDDSVAKVNKMFLIAGRVSLGNKTAVKKAMMRGIYAGIAALGSTGLPMDLAALMKHEKSKDLDKAWTTAMEAIQSILQIIGMMGESDIGVTDVFSGSGMNGLMTGLSGVDGTSMAVSDAGVSSANEQEARAIKAIAKDQAAIDVLQFMMDQITKQGQAQQDAYAKLMTSDSKSNMSLAVHFSDAEMAMAHALSVLAV